MAFLCPSRLGRTKQKHEVHSSILERISGDVGFDPLAKFELARYNANNPEAVRIILHNFSTCSPDELTVRQGQKVHILFREGDWAYVLTADKKEGFVPYTACAKLVTASSKTPTKTDAPTGSDRTEPKQSDRINNNTYNVRNDKSVVIHHVHNERLHVTDNFLSTDWSNKSHKRDAAINVLKAKCASQPSERYDDNRNLINSYLSSSPYGKLPKFLEVFNALQAEDVQVKSDDDISDVLPGRRDDSDISMSPRQTFDDEISPRTVCSINTNESSFMSETSTDVNSDDSYVVLHNFRGRHRDDVDVERNEKIVVLEKSDPFWYWIRRRDGREGYVPSNYIGHLKDPKVLAILEERYKRDAVRPGHTTHHAGCKCEECARMSPATDVCSLASSTLNSETKARPPKPPRTRIKVPTDSTQTPRSKTKSSSRKQHSARQVDHKPQSSNSSKFTSHHLSLENVSVANNKNDGPSTKLKSTGSTTDLHQSRKKSTRHRRPNYREYRSQSTRSYTFEESTDYFDAYFCDEPDPDFKLKPDNKVDVVNVTEILKQRNASSRSAKTRSHSHGKTPHGNTWMKNGSTDNGHNVLNLRQYMQTLPSTAIVTEQEKHDEKPKTMSASEVSKHQETRRDKRERRSADHPQRLDWSFGYPRKQRSNHNSRCSSTPDPNTLDIVLSKGHKPIGVTTKSNVKTVGSQTDLEDVGVIPNALEGPSDQMFLDLLNATDSLLDVSEKILSSSKANAKKANTDNSVKGGDRRSSSSETDDDVNDKCNNFIMNQVVDTSSGLLTNRSETSCTVMSDVSRNSRDKMHEYSDECSDEVFREVNMPEDKHLNGIDTTTLAAGVEQGKDNIDGRNNNNRKSCNQDMETSYTSNPTDHNNTENARANKKSRTSDSSSKKMSVRDETDNPSSPGTIDTKELFDETVNYMDVRGVTEFVVQYDFDPAPDSELAISICRNEILHISLDIQEDESWYWAFSPRLHTYGYVPRDYVKIPLVTII